MNKPRESDADRFKAIMRAEWTDALVVSGWRTWHTPFAACMRAATEAVMHASRLAPGMRVLDLASGTGEPALSIAR